MLDNYRINDLKDDYTNVVNDLDFEKLELELDKPNIFDIMGATNNELRHSNLLAWFLDPAETHGLHNAILKKVLREISRDDKALLEEIDVEELDYSNTEIRREWNNIDILIIIGKTVVCIENKIWSKETGDQLRRYKEIVEKNFNKDYRKIYVYLTPYGETPTYESDSFVSVSYRIIAEAIERILQIQEDDINDKTIFLLKDYLTIIKRYIMQDDKVIEYAKRVYQNHRRIFDFVFENKPDVTEEIRNYIEEKFNEQGWRIASKNKGYARFTTDRLDALLPKTENSYGWLNKDSFLFEIDFWWSSKQDHSDARLLFKAVVGPNENTELQELLSRTIESIPDAKKPSGKKWRTYFNKKQTFKYQDVLVDITALDGALEKLLHFMVPVVDEIEKVILSKEYEIKAISK